jgi:ubiquitin carboxyl-terminal hydrolase 9/24
MNIDCQIRGKADIHEALSTMCEVEYMEGDNKVYCDRCKKNTDTVLRTAISALPDVLILSLKRFDLDYNTFETVKLNSRCAFEQSLNMKKYTMEGVEAMEKASTMSEDDNHDSDEMYVDPLSALPDADYEYRLAGVLVHHGVAQGGHYYSFIRDRTNKTEGHPDKWFRFDDEDVTPFDASQIEVECFGGKVKKETKWPNGQVNTVETEQLANALMLFYEKVKPSTFDPKSEKDTEMDETEDIPPNLPLATGVDVFEGDVMRSNSVHRSHAFLFDGEFQRFIRRMLDKALATDSDHVNDRMMVSSPESDRSLVEDYSLLPWRVPILELSISFFFDVLLHSVDKVTLNDWSNVLSSALAVSSEGSRWVVHEIAKRTRTVNNNWIRIFASDCPEKASRQAAMYVIVSSMKGCLSQPGEVASLKSWTQAWSQQLKSTSALSANGSPQYNTMPISLEGELQSHEDLSKIDSFGASSLGVIISYLCLLLELAPRTWQYNAELCYLLKEIGSIPATEGGEIMRDALISAQIPARLIALLLRDKAPAQLQTAMPSASISFDLCESIVKPVTNPTAHVFPINSSVGSNTGVGAANTGVGTPSPSDHVNALEALASILGIAGSKSAKLVVDTGEVKGRTIYDLTNDAKEALAIVFNECSSQPGLMDQKDIMNYMKLCGVDTMAVSQHRINNILGKYGNESKHLNVEGFISYYRDISQSNSLQVGFIHLIL